MAPWFWRVYYAVALLGLPEKLGWLGLGAEKLKKANCFGRVILNG
jgi:hypothetical protein